MVNVLEFVLVISLDYQLVNWLVHIIFVWRFGTLNNDVGLGLLMLQSNIVDKIEFADLYMLIELLVVLHHYYLNN